MLSFTPRSLWSRSRNTYNVGEGLDDDISEKESIQEFSYIDVSPGGLTFEEDAAGGLGRHLGVTTCTLLIVGHIINTGIFSAPSTILSEVGSVGASLMLWVLGFALSFCGLFIWLEFGTMFPRSGGEKVYLEVAFDKPNYLSSVIFAANIMLLGFTANACLVFGSSILTAAGRVPDIWAERGIALGVIIFVTLLHGLTPRIGVYLMNLLTIFKVAILIFIVITGWVVLSGKTHIPNPHANFVNAFAGSSHRSGNYATATFQILFACSGWSNANYVLNNVRNPVRTLKIAGPLGLGICAVLYILTNVAFFSATTKAEIESSGLTVAALFFKNVFGAKAERALNVFMALSAIGSVMTLAFATGRINQEIAKEGVPLPFSNKFWASNWPTGKAPLPGLIIHLIPSIVVILAPSVKIGIPFMLDVERYPNQVISFLIAAGVFIMRWKRPDIHRPFKVWLPLAFLYLATTVFLVVTSFLPPPDRAGDSPPLPYYIYCFVAYGATASGMAYWAVWRVLLPKIFGYELVPRKEELEDGTVVTLFSHKKIQ